MLIFSLFLLDIFLLSKLGKAYALALSELKCVFVKIALEEFLLGLLGAFGD